MKLSQIAFVLGFFFVVAYINRCSHTAVPGNQKKLNTAIPGNPKLVRGKSVMLPSTKRSISTINLHKGTKAFFERQNLKGSTTSLKHSIVHSTEASLKWTPALLKEYAFKDQEIQNISGILDTDKWLLIKNIYPKENVHRPFYLFYQPTVPYLFSSESQVIRHFGQVLKKCRERKGQIILDMGMNEGFFSLLSAASSCTVFGFEPQPGCISKIIPSVSRNDLPGVLQVINAGVGSRQKGLMKSSPNACDPGKSFTKKYAKKEQSSDVLVNMVALDVLFPTQEIALLHIDVEGFEPVIMTGAKNMLLEGRVKNLIYEQGGGYSKTWTAEQKNLVQTVRSAFKNCKLVSSGNHFCTNDDIRPLEIASVDKAVTEVQPIRDSSTPTIRLCHQDGWRLKFCTEEDSYRQQGHSGYKLHPKHWKYPSGASMRDQTRL